MSWILVLFMASGGTSQSGVAAVQIGPFATKEECVAASTPAMRVANEVSWRVRAVCLPTSKEGEVQDGR